MEAVVHDDDLIRRGDAKGVARRPFLPFSLGGDLICDPEQGECTANAIDRIPAATPALDAAAMQPHDYQPSMNPMDQGDCAICGNGPHTRVPTPADHLAEALTLPEVAALVAAEKRYRMAVLAFDGSGHYEAKMAEANAASVAIDAALRAIVAERQAGVTGLRVAMVTADLDLSDCDDLPSGPAVILTGDIQALRGIGALLGKEVVIRAALKGPNDDQ